MLELGVVLGDHPVQHQGQLRVGLAEPVRGVRGPELLELLAEDLLNPGDLNLVEKAARLRERCCDRRAATAD
eukprot:11642557-Alexandrium_andersonii.AAC.1